MRQYFIFYAVSDFITRCGPRFSLRFPPSLAWYFSTHERLSTLRRRLLALAEVAAYGERLARAPNQQDADSQQYAVDLSSKSPTRQKPTPNVASFIRAGTNTYHNRRRKIATFNCQFFAGLNQGLSYI